MNLSPNYHTTLWLFLLTTIFGCSASQIDSENAQRSSDWTLLSISEAKSAFEQAYSLALTKSGHKVERKNKLSPGEFTPVWDCATFSENPDACSFDIQIIPERKIYAITAEFRNGRSIAKKVRVSQRLVTVKTKKYGRTCCYLMSLIPDCTYNDGSNAIEHFYNCGQKDNFSGLAIYSTLVSDCVIGIDRYINGIKKDNVYIPKGKGSVHSRIEKAASMLKGICLVNHRIVSTKSFGEDFWDDDYDDNWDYGNPDDYTDVGDGYFEDGDGNLYYDTDGDGVPDSMVIEGGGIDGNGNEGGNDGTDDSWWLWNPDSENNGESDSEDDPYYNMDGDSDEPSETEETENDNETDVDFERGKEGLAKMQNDLKNGDVTLRQIIDASLTAFSVSTNSNGIIFSAAAFLEDISQNKEIIEIFGKGLGTANLCLSATQTLIIIYDEEDLSTGEVLSIVSTALQGCVFLTSSFPIAGPYTPIVSGALGILSGIIGIASLFVSNGWYLLESHNGKSIYIYISTNSYYDVA